MPDRLATPAGVAPQQPGSVSDRCSATSARPSSSVSVLAVAAFWILGQLDEWRLATSLAIGVALGLVNHLATERWLLGLLTSGREPTRAVMMRSTMVRLVVLTVVAVTIAVLFWPDGIGRPAGAGRLPPHRPGDDHDPPAEGAEGAMNGSSARLPQIEIHTGRAPEIARVRSGMTFNLDTIWSTLVAGAIVVLLLGLPGRAASSPRRPTTTSRPSSSCSGRPSSARSTPRSRTTSAGCTPTSCRWRSRCSSSSSFANWLELIPTELNDEDAPAAVADRGHQPHLRHGAPRDGQRLDLRHPAEGR